MQAGWERSAPNDDFCVRRCSYHLIQLYAGFSDSPSVVPIVGQNGFFDKFEITFDRVAEIIILKELGDRNARGK
jgi:hypothetical protein